MNKYKLVFVYLKAIHLNLYTRRQEGCIFVFEMHIAIMHLHRQKYVCSIHIQAVCVLHFCCHIFLAHLQHFISSSSPTLYYQLTLRLVNVFVMFLFCCYYHITLCSRMYFACYLGLCPLNCLCLVLMQKSSVTQTRRNHQESRSTITLLLLTRMFIGQKILTAWRWYYNSQFLCRLYLHALLWCLLVIC